ncbi:S-layer homology domain-containing protein [Brevibacillus halotolerans]|uniref:S-layer homology domain-containing protein n=1 Tax=Brevibacillus halotolerans TaxID=1507437 RepID=UPI001FE88BB6|nr:S-layer homology domain-containing protein [Brevibacillus halotolerans]
MYMFNITLRCKYEKGIVLGDEKGNLHPDQPATRAEVITFIDRAVEYVLKEVK